MIKFDNLMLQHYLAYIFNAFLVQFAVVLLYQLQTHNLVI